MSIKELMLIVFLINLPFGYMRGKTAAFSARWLLAVHLPVPFIFLLRRFFDFGWSAAPLLILAAAAGQLLGGKHRKFR
ncbi:MAG: hypothetical protein KKH28_07905 [Elusimicrobia bacterium]|nr:hypothetical protein [Elusimicrobiota bacterium]